MLNRRTFLASSAQAAALTLLAQSVPAQTVSPQPDILSRMTWLNPPPLSHIDHGRLTVHSTPKADFYRMPGWIIDTGNFFHLPIEGDFLFQARISGDYISQYDQTGLMVRQDTENWMKCGVEFADNQRCASVVITRDLSDWSTMRSPTQTASIWWRVTRKHNSLQMFTSLDGINFTSVRQSYGYLASTPRLEVGLYCASTQGNGVAATFDSIKLTKI